MGDGADICASRKRMVFLRHFGRLSFMQSKETVMVEVMFAHVVR